MDSEIEITRNLQGIELNILKCYIDAVNSLKLKYYLLGGTMLGAVRHGGFIPWDDDIDVGMPRSDYEIFLEKGQSYLPKGLFLQHRTTDSQYPQNYIKIRDSRTTFVETSVSKVKMNHGVYIDVFPLDYYPDNKEEQKKIDRRNNILHLRMRSAYLTKDYIKCNPLKALIIKIISTILRYKYRTMDDALNAREKLNKSTNCSSFIANYCGAWGKKEIVPAYFYGKGVTLNFEGIEVIVPSEYDKWLTQVYGDYKQLPPKEKRVSHHYCSIIDFSRSYTEYLHITR